MADNETVREDEESEQFNSMLNAAQKHVGSKEGGSSLSQAQIEAMLAENDDDVPDATGTSGPGSDNADGSSGDDTPADYADEDTAIADRLREGISADAQAAAEENEVKEKKKKEKKPKVKKEKKPLDKATLAKMLIAAAIVVALVLGYLVCLVFFTDVLKTPEEEFSIKAAAAVDSMLARGSEMYVYKAYVRNSASAEECMLYAVTMDGESEKTDMYHVVIYRDDPNKINVYYTLDTESRRYQKMHDSDDPAERILAANLKSYSDAIIAADKEIQIGTPGWIKIDCTMINKALIKPVEETAAQ